MRSFLARFRKDQSGATAIEYGLLLALLSMVVIAAVGVLGTGLNAKYNAIGNAVK